MDAAPADVCVNCDDDESGDSTSTRDGEESEDSSTTTSSDSDSDDGDEEAEGAADNGSAAAAPTAEQAKFVKLFDGKQPQAVKVMGKDADVAGGGRATFCPLTRDEFLKGGYTLPIRVGGEEFAANARGFATGSFGFHVQQKVPIVLGGRKVVFQMQCQLVAVNSKRVGHKKTDKKRGRPERSVDPALAARLKRAKQVTLDGVLGVPKAP